jgi:hypothetical protein
VRGFVVGALLVLLLAGCSGNVDPGATGGGSGAGGQGTGVLRGIVVDEAIRPLADAKVVASGASGTLNTTTGPDGLFGFDGLAPGAYIVEVSKAFYSAHQQAVDVRQGDTAPPVAKFLLSFQAESVPYVDLYKFEGLFECGSWWTNGCANVNILTGVILCAYNLPCFNVTNDRSVELIPITPQPTFLQSEMVWEATTELGKGLRFVLAAATREELQDGFIDGYNSTHGESPLLLRLHNESLEESRIGIEGRQLVIQVWGGSSIEPPTGCPPIGFDPCGLGLNVQQPYTTYTHAFYGYEPPAEWRFTSGEPVPQPPA